MSSEPKLNGYKVCELVPHTEAGITGCGIKVFPVSVI